MKVLLTGFEPYGQERVNSSWEAVKAHPEFVEGVEIVKECLPVSFERAGMALGKVVALYQPDVVLSVGQAGGRCEINVERVAVNMADFKKADNDGCQPCERRLFLDAPDAYFSNLPVKCLVDAIRKAGIPAVISNSAGLYVCNSVFYSAMHMVYSKYPNMQVGFLHVPYLPCQVVEKVKQPSMAAEMVVQALKIVIHTLVSVT
ncbi:MAG: pyroglutamyl-peptidase I [Bacteroidales bacterium]|nr:pyroglutamyl-peptidase I [Bacteroidales bacterium]